MTVDGADLRGRPARAPDEAIMYQAPLYTMFGAFIGAAALGIAEAAVQVHRSNTRRRVVRSTSRPAVNDETQQIEIAEAEACVSAARRMLHGICDDATAILEAGRQPTMEERTRFRSEAAFAGQLSARAVNVAWEAGGSGGVYETNPLSRLFLDMTVANRHLTQQWDVNAATFGRVVLGLPVDNPAL
jgi:3-hydroxy-9,10-secoandrosta-1,3,5(10)-triene-9,17-dione monooxygenase